MKPTVLIILILLSLGAFNCASDMKTIECRYLPSTKDATIGSNPMNSYITEFNYYFKAESYDSALIVLHKAYALNQDNWRIPYGFALVALRHNHANQAIQYINQALTYTISSRTDRALLYTVLGQAEEIKSRPGKAQVHYLTAIQLDESCHPAIEGLKRLRQLTINQ